MAHSAKEIHTAQAPLFDLEAEITPLERLTVSWSVVQTALHLLSIPLNESRIWPNTPSTTLIERVNAQDSAALAELLAGVIAGHSADAANLFTLVTSKLVEIEPIDWLQFLLLGEELVVVWVIEAAPELRPALAETFLTLVQNSALRSQWRSHKNSNWPFSCTDLLWTGDLDPVELLNQLQRVPHLAKKLGRTVAEQLASPWGWRSLHVPSPLYLRRLCVWRDLLSLLRHDINWPTTVRGWPSHIWPPQPFPQLSEMTVSDAQIVVAYWKTLSLEGEAQ